MWISKKKYEDLEFRIGKLECFKGSFENGHYPRTYSSGGLGYTEDYFSELYYPAEGNLVIKKLSLRIDAILNHLGLKVKREPSKTIPERITLVEAPTIVKI